MKHEIGSANGGEAPMSEIGCANSDEARMREIGSYFGALAHKELFQSNDGETMDSVWQNLANCRTAETAADYRRAPDPFTQKLDAYYYKERPETQRFVPQIESAICLELTMEAANLASDARRLVAIPRPEVTSVSSMSESDKSLWRDAGVKIKYMKETIKKYSPEDVSTMITLANKLLDKSGIQFVYNDEGYVDLISPDGRIDVLAKPRNPRRNMKV